MFKKLFTKKVNQSNVNENVKGYSITWDQIVSSTPTGYDTVYTIEQAEKKKKDLLKSDYIFNIKINPIY
jgi:hypothetical protein